MARKQIPALVVKQWPPDWDSVEFSVSALRRKPRDYFLLFTLDAYEVRRLAGIQRRSATGARASELGIQRALVEERSREIADYVKRGFPWSGLSKKKRQSPKYRDLEKPGWLPTAIVANIIEADDVRGGLSVHKEDQLTVILNRDGSATITLPDCGSPDWSLSGSLPPIEVIDGQHRLWAFDENTADIGSFQLPIVAFHGLDISWQAYLFYTINIKPKRINPSFAFDLYPLLRTEDWLEKFDDNAYRTARAQELTEALWSYPESPWYQRINMLGGRAGSVVTQSSWVRNLQATIVKSWEGPRVQIGGLFGAPVGEDELVLPWGRAQQAGFLIYPWQVLKEEVIQSRSEWAVKLSDNDTIWHDSAFAGNETMLNSDMGVRGFLYMLNDLCFVMAQQLELHNWKCDLAPATDFEAIRAAIMSLMEEPAGRFIRNLARCLAQYDWRSSKARSLTETERQLKARFRGSGGYKELRQELLRYLMGQDDDVAQAAHAVARQLSYDINP